MTKKGAYYVGKTKRGKGIKVMAITDAAGVIFSVSVHGASPHKVTLVVKTLTDRFIIPHPERLIGIKHMTQTRWMKDSKSRALN